MTSIIECNNIRKNYDKVIALNDVSLSVNKGEIFGVIGPDGAGKTTLFRILTTLLNPSSGSAMIDGFDVIKDYKSIRKDIGYMPGKFSLYTDLSVRENLEIFASIFHTTIEENYHLIKDIYQQIEKFETRRAGALSGGMKQKLALCCAMIHKPKLIVLDEPTTGVDPVSRKEFWDMLKKLKEQGITILVATPYMDEASMCDRIALIQNGKILHIETPQKIKELIKKKVIAISANNMFQLLKDIRSYPNYSSCYTFGDSHHVTVNSENNEPENLKIFLSQKAHENIKLQVIEPSIEDCFMQLSAAN